MLSDTHYCFLAGEDIAQSTNLWLEQSRLTLLNPSSVLCCHLVVGFFCEVVKFFGVCFHEQLFGWGCLGETTWSFDSIRLSRPIVTWSLEYVQSHTVIWVQWKPLNDSEHKQVYSVLLLPSWTSINRPMSSSQLRSPNFFLQVVFAWRWKFPALEDLAQWPHCVLPLGKRAMQPANYGIFLSPLTSEGLQRHVCIQTVAGSSLRVKRCVNSHQPQVHQN